MINLRNPGQFLAVVAFALTVGGLVSIAFGIGSLLGEAACYIAVGIVLVAAGIAATGIWSMLFRAMGGGVDGEAE